MTGKISHFVSGDGSGKIESESGAAMDFQVAAVLAYDLPYLGVGQQVTFDVQEGTDSTAINVSLHNLQKVHYTADKLQEIRRLRFAGFEHKGSFRVFRFERNSPGEHTSSYLVRIDMALFTKHSVAIQEGPALCLKKLAAWDDATRPPEQQLTEQDILVHVEERRAAAALRTERRSGHRQSNVGSSTSGWHNPRPAEPPSANAPTGPVWHIGNR